MPHSTIQVRTEYVMLTLDYSGLKDSTYRVSICLAE